MQIVNWFKTTADILPFQWNWADWLSPQDDPLLADDQIVAVSVVAKPASLAVGEVSIVDGSIVRAFVSGGLVGTVYTLTCTIQTAAGLTASSQRKLEIADDAR